LAFELILTAVNHIIPHVGYIKNILRQTSSD